MTDSTMSKSRYILFILFISGFFLSNRAFAQDENNESDSTNMHRQHMIHSMSPEVMPFKMDKVTHYFIKDSTGGILMLKTKDPGDTTQAALVQSHLYKECSLFSNADFRDPRTLHGVEMPGLKTLSESKGEYKVEYEKLSDGAKLTFISQNAEVINAIHLWFDAQLRDHGRDAKSRLD